MPITWPWSFRSGPPLLPWLIAASVWIAFAIGWLFGDVIVRSSADTIPVETLSARPKGSPIAITASPTRSLVEFPNVSGCRSADDASMWMTATSVVGSLPTSVAL